VIIALAVTRDGMPVRSWVLAGNNVTTVARIKDDRRAWRLGRCLFVGDAGMYSADNLTQLSRGLGRYILAVPMRRVRDIEDAVLTRPGRYKQVADNLQSKRYGSVTASGVSAMCCVSTHKRPSVSARVGRSC
jgi:hypothetical protein